MNTPFSRVIPREHFDAILDAERCDPDEQHRKAWLDLINQCVIRFCLGMLAVLVPALVYMEGWL